MNTRENIETPKAKKEIKSKKENKVTMIEFRKRTPYACSV